MKGGPLIDLDSSLSGLLPKTGSMDLGTEFAKDS